MATQRNPMLRALGEIVGLVLSLYVFDEVIDAIWGFVNTSTYFSTAVTFIQNLFPVLGILAAFEITIRALRSGNIL